MDIVERIRLKKSKRFNAKDKINTSDTFICPIPFEESVVSMTNSGDFSTSVCCVDWLKPKYKGFTKIPNNGEVKEAFNGDLAQGVRSGILDGTYSGCDCDKCPKLKGGIGNSGKKIGDMDGDTSNKILRGDLIGYTPIKYTDASVATCNLTCPSCRDSLVKIEDNKVEEAKNIFLKTVKEVKSLFFLISGEFMLIPHLKEFARTFSKESYPDLEDIKVMSNGTLLSDKAIRSFSDDFWDTVGEVTISIDAATADMYKVVRKGGNFGILILNLKNLSSFIKPKGINFTISFVVQKENFTEMTEFVELASLLGVDRIDFCEIRPWAGSSLVNVDVCTPGHELHEDYKFSRNSAVSRAAELGILINEY